ncbi:hypothetical protein [Aquimarina sp. AD10]|uniref:hypothetical protein n=1 Tax=Aquimarina sp. AD10 TaxID=1714849 RepID=UPI000EA883E0|nr:hypothetical protein [Aquimarina sp. AD10]RKM99961.1 hypothetical protein D7033_10210 [Aquimarina sp. AD10]
MIKSKIDFGTFDLDNEQHFSTFYFHIKKIISSGGVSDIEEEEQTVKEQRWAAKKQKSPKPENTFETAIVGAGAAAAYHLTSLGKSHDFSNTLLIGTQQPWKVTRGPGKIGHPLHMITPFRDILNLEDEDFADRNDFSDLLTKVFRELIPEDNWKQTLVSAVNKIKITETFYKISAGDTDYYAQKVIYAIGAGPHLEPSKINRHEPKDTNASRIMDMDRFTRTKAGVEETLPLGVTQKDPGDVNVIVVGPNAGIDVVSDVKQRGYKVQWLVGSKAPRFFQGTPNELARLAYEKENAGYIGYYDSAIESSNGVDVIYTNPRTKKVEGTLKGDLLVYAIGPDMDAPGGPRSILSKDIQKSLRPDYDDNQRFQSSDETEPVMTVLGLKTPPQHKPAHHQLDGHAKGLVRMATTYNQLIYDVVKHKHGVDIGRMMNGIAQEYNDMLTEHENSDEKTLNIGFNFSEVYRTIEDFRRIWERDQEIENPTEAMVNVIDQFQDELNEAVKDAIYYNREHDAMQDKNDDTSLQVIGASAFRLGAEVEEDYIDREGIFARDGYHELTKLREIYHDLDPLEGSEENVKIGRMIGYMMDEVCEEFANTLPDFREEIMVNLLFADRSQDIHDLAKMGTLTEGYANAINKFLNAIQSGTRALLRYNRAAIYWTKAMKTKGRRGDTTTATSGMKGIPDSLPMNMLVAEQLTPIRAATASKNAHVSSFSETGVNFTVDDQTEIRVHIATHYPGIPEKKADEVAQQIVDDRKRKDQEAPLPLMETEDDIQTMKSRTHRARKFQQKWETHLRRLNLL